MDSESYETGYREGGSSRTADIILAFSEAGTMDDLLEFFRRITGDPELEWPGATGTAAPTLSGAGGLVPPGAVTAELRFPALTAVLHAPPDREPEDPAATELRILAADLHELHRAGALRGVRAVAFERLRQVRGEAPRGIDGRAYRAALLAEEIDRDA